MKLRGRSDDGPVTAHSKDNTFCAVDVHPAELFHEPIVDDERISYTGIFVPQPEFFLDFVQWKETENLEHRMQLLRKIQSLVDQENHCAVLCVSVGTPRGEGWTTGRRLLEDAINRNASIEALAGNKSGRYRFDGREFKEAHAVSMALYAGALATLVLIFSRQITKAESLASLRSPSLQFLLDTVSGDPATGHGTRWNLDLILYFIENTPFGEILTRGLQKSCFDRYGIEIAVNNEIEGVVTEGNSMPLMVAVDWFAKICNRYQELQDHEGDMDEDDAVILKIAKTLIAKKCLLIQSFPGTADT